MSQSMQHGIPALLAHRVIPVATLDDAAVVAPLAETLAATGLSVVEITLRTAAAFEAIFVSTGGIGTGNLADYLRLPAVAACVGSWMIEREQLRAKRYDLIRQTIHATLRILSQAGKDLN